MMAGIPEKDPRAAAAEAAWSDLKAARADHERDWEEIGRLIRPTRRGFISADPSQTRSERLLNSGAIIANNNFSSGIWGTLNNPANKWFGTKSSDAALNAFQPMKEWNDAVAGIIAASFSSGVSPFYSATTQLYGDIAALGNSAQIAEMRQGERRIVDQTISMAEICYDIDADGQVIETIRRFRLSPVQAAHKFGIDMLPEKIADQAKTGSRDKLIFYHHVYKNRDWIKGRLGPSGKRWHSIHTSEDGGAVLRHSGYDEMPFLAPRWEVETGESYGVGPGWIALASARKMDLMERANLRAGQRAADPTVLAPERDVWSLNGRLRPGSVVYGGMDMAGRKMLGTLDTVSGTGLTMEMQQQALDQIRDAFHWSLMNLAGRTGMTATEVIERQEEKLRLMAPHLGRVQEEFLGPKIAQRFAMLWKSGQIPPPPPEAAGADLVIEYTSAAAMAAKSAEGAATMRLIQDLTPLAQFKPRVLDRISADDAVEVLAEARGVPARLLASREEADQIAEARAQQAQQAQMMEAAKAGGGIARDLAAAGMAAE